ncbi:IS110 family transposase [Paludicola sp. MB14-C6]|uniref:IS110 family transposase n=1 Tax=Paludihabitans sp. MB14-C6 TaxID=3070656 RepID=UPI0027DC9920|nr:IS110 family transposase [Paludicola sp. MB14-C6]WMJ24010.1 IS110 family transposase [Paludicola sp. MB14-C6]
MSNNLFISVGIDVGADFSFMSIALPNQTFWGKPFKITHSNLNSLDKAILTIKEAEELNSLKARIFLESTGIYHYPLFCYLRDKGFDVSVINPIITKSSTNINIRKVHNDKFDSKKLALVALKPDLKTSVIPSNLVLDLRNLTREYYNLVDCRSAYVNKLQGELRVSFPQYISIFSKLTVETSLVLLEKYTSPQAFLSARKSSVIKLIMTTARFGVAYAEDKYKRIIEAAKSATAFGYAVPSNFTLIKLYISFIRKYNEEIESVLNLMYKLVDNHSDETFVKQIHLLESIKGSGFLSAVTVMCEIGDFSVFKSPKQLFAYFGLDPAVKQSGKFIGTDVKMSKRGSRIARRAIHTIALVSIGLTRKGDANNPVLRDYYLSKCQSKPKMVALGAVMHKVCNIIFAVLRDEKEFSIITPQQHKLNFLNSTSLAA